METKTNKAISLFQSGNLKESLSIFRNFRIGFTKDERRTLQIASESLSGNTDFYQQIGVDTYKEIEKSKQLVRRKYFRNDIKNQRK